MTWQPGDPLFRRPAGLRDGMVRPLVELIDDDVCWSAWRDARWPEPFGHDDIGRDDPELAVPR